MRFLGSPTLRVNGHDVDPASGRDTKDAYALQCRLYATPTGTTEAPPGQWILDAPVANPTHEGAISAVLAGDLPALGELLREYPHLATVPLARSFARRVAPCSTSLLDAGADIDAPGAVIAGGTPMADATAFGQWPATRLLLERGAKPRTCSSPLPSASLIE